jgi:antirestriction protein ArdC
MTTTASRTSTRKPAKTRRPSVTPEERKAQAEALHESIATQVEQLRNSDRWTQFLAFAAAFHAYSLNNVLLILSQRPDAERVAGFRKWQALGRQVRKGEKSLRIFGYSTKKVTEQDENGEDVEKRYPRFPILSVFDIAQTDPVDPDTADPSTLAAPLTGTDDHGVIATLTAHLEADGWSVEHTEPGQGRNGFTEPEGRRVVIGSHLSPEHGAKTLIHELAHIVLGHTDDLTEYAEHRGLMETEAESVAYVVAGLVGFDTAAYSIGYVAGWSDADTDLIRSTAARVLTAAHQVAGILNPEPEDDDDPEQ